MNHPRLFAFVAAAFLCVPCVSGETMWFNGDFNAVDGVIAVNHGFGALDIDAYVYDDFIFGNKATVTGLFGYFLASGDAPVGAEYQIRAGVAENDGGTLVASGSTSAFAWTDTGGTFESPFFGTLGVFRLDIGALDVPLNGGTYWLGLRPITSLTGTDVFLAETSGANSIGTPGGNNGNSFIDSTSLGFAFDRPDPTGNLDFWLGVEATADGLTAAPEPRQFLPILTGLIVIFAFRKQIVTRPRQA